MGVAEDTRIRLRALLIEEMGEHRDGDPETVNYCWWCMQDINGLTGDDDTKQPHLPTCWLVRVRAALTDLATVLDTEGDRPEHATTMCGPCSRDEPCAIHPRADTEGDSTPPQRWQPIAICPKMRTVLLFAVSDVDEHGTVKNWKMATGSWLEGYEDERSKARGMTPWNWDGHQLKVYELHPTHWMPLPPAPTSEAEGLASSAAPARPMDEPTDAQLSCGFALYGEPALCTCGTCSSLAASSAEGTPQPDLRFYGHDTKGHWRQCRYCMAYWQVKVDGVETGDIVQHVEPCPVGELERLQAVEWTPQWQTAALLKDRTRTAICDRVQAGEPLAEVAADYGVPVAFVEALVAWQFGAAEGTPPDPDTEQP